MTNPMDSVPMPEPDENMQGNERAPGVYESGYTADQLRAERLSAYEMGRNAGLDNLTDEQRMEVFSKYCTHCGSKDPSCQCWNDE